MSRAWVAATARRDSSAVRHNDTVYCGVGGALYALCDGNPDWLLVPDALAPDLLAGLVREPDPDQVHMHIAMDYDPPRSWTRHEWRGEAQEMLLGPDCMRCFVRGPQACDDHRGKLTIPEVVVKKVFKLPPIYEEHADPQPGWDVVLTRNRGKYGPENRHEFIRSDGCRVLLGLDQFPNWHVKHPTLGILADYSFSDPVGMMRLADKLIPLVE